MRLSQRRRTAALGAALAAALGAQAVSAAVVTRGPYLQRLTPYGVTLRWRTDAPTDSAVRVGSNPQNLSGTKLILQPTTEHEVVLTSLSPARRYYYSVGTSSGPLAGGDASHVFETPPLPGTRSPTRVWVIGDSGTANYRAAAVRDAYLAWPGSAETDVWLMLGDNAYNDGTDAEFQAAVFDMYPTLLRRTAVWPTFGNHEAHTASSTTQSGPYFDIFTLPRLAEAGGLASGTEAYYAFDFANVHFVCLDSQGRPLAAGGPMLSWLEADLESTAQDWIVAYWHHPPDSKGSHDSDADSALTLMRQLVVPILERHGVDLVLAGHSHSYERSMLLDGHYGLSSSLTPEMVLDAGDGNPAGDGAYEKGGLGPTPHDGAVYAVAGSSGGVGGGTYDHPVMVVSLAELGSLVLDFDASRLEARFLSSTGAVRDAFAIAKPAPGSLACSDGIDNDRDGERDFPADSGCKNALAPREDPPCHDGIDNDRDGLVDADDPYCLVSEREGPTCGLGFEIALAAPLLRRLAARRRGRGGGAGCRARGGGSSLGVMARPHATLALAAVLLLAALPGRAHEPLAEELAELDARADTASHVDLLLRRGELHRIRGETGLALADFEHARRLGAPAGEIERLRAHALLEAGRAAEARQAALAALEREPGSGDARLLEARALAALGRRGEAARAYDAALASLRDPGPDLYLERAALAAGPEPALAVVEAGLARLGPAASLELRAIELECALDRFDAALARLARLAERAPRRSPWLLRRAEILAAAGRGEEALRSLDEARRLAATERGGRPTPAETARALEVERAVGSSRTDASS